MPANSLSKIIALLCFIYCGLFVGFGLTARSSSATFSGGQDAQVDGQKIAAVKCAACHSFQSSGQVDPEELERSQGPTLAYAGNKFQLSWLEKWLIAPYRIRPAGYLSYRYVVNTADGDRVDEAALPVHMALPPAEAKAVASYLTSLKKEPNAYPASETASTVRAQLHFEKILGCGSCHQIQQGRGGLSGPELYTAYERLDRGWGTAFMAEPNYWNTIPMPKISIRTDQLAALSDYLFQAPTEKPVPSPDPVRKETVAKTDKHPTKGRVELIYQMYCSQCHGINGDGKGINAPSLFVAPRNHTSAQEMGMLTDDRLYAAIRYGGTAVGKSALMPSWGGVLKDSDIKLLVEHLRVLSGTGTGEGTSK
jgi:mono/diheme cytochrome c family protein